MEVHFSLKRLFANTLLIAVVVEIGRATGHPQIMTLPPAGGVLPFRHAVRSMTSDVVSDELRILDLTKEGSMSATQPTSKNDFAAKQAAEERKGKPDNALDE